MDVKIYKIDGEFKQNGKKHTFSIDVRALSPKTAFQRLWSNLGSKHGLKMRDIKIKASLWFTGTVILKPWQT